MCSCKASKYTRIEQTSDVLEQHFRQVEQHDRNKVAPAANLLLPGPPRWALVAAGKVARGERGRAERSAVNVNAHTSLSLDTV